MPPLPRTLDEQTQQLVSSAQRLQHDLVDFQIPRLRDCKGPLATQQRLAAELREDIDRLARYVEVCARNTIGGEGGDTILTFWGTSDARSRHWRPKTRTRSKRTDGDRERLQDRIFIVRPATPKSFNPFPYAFGVG
jgi:hypothetical protein